MNVEDFSLAATHRNQHTNYQSSTILAKGSKKMDTGILYIDEYKRYMKKTILIELKT